MFSFKNLIKFGLILGFVGFAALVGLYLSMRGDLPSVESLKDIQWQTPMQIYSADGKLISQFGEKKRIPLTLEETPPQLINAILATEDDRFYQHFGIDPIGIFRAIFGIIIGENKGGGSTITQQVARNFFLTRERSYIRKIKEIFISFHIESLLSKDEILGLYLNKIELGHRSFGFGAAAQVYYGKDVKDLSLAEIAVLAGLPKAPSTLNPISSPERALARRNVVLYRMLVSGYITQEEYDSTSNMPNTAKKHGAEIELDSPYIAEMIHQEMINLYGKEQAYSGGFRVFSTVHSDRQLAAKEAVINNLIRYDQRHGYRGAITSIRPELKLSSDSNKAKVPPADINPITNEEISEVLANIASIEHLMPAVVTDVFDNIATIAVNAHNRNTLEWEGMSWAREFINDNKQGPAPKSAHDILTVGDVIWVSKENGSYILNQLPQVSGALVALSPDDGAVEALIGGFSFRQSQFNRAVQAKRQVGSNIKPFLYSAALEHNFTLASIINDAPINEWDRRSGVVWRPQNSPATYQGPIRLRLALAQSKNVVAVRLLREVGISGVIDHLAKFGFIPHELPRDESLSLGSASLTPMEVATGFATFANGGFLITPYFIDRIEDSFGNVLFKANPKRACSPCNVITETSTPTLDDEFAVNELNQDENIPLNGDEESLTVIKEAPQVISSQNAFLITEALNSAIWGADWSVTPGWQGTGYRARALKRRDIAGKTGTTNESKDAWFSGYSKHLVATTWIGFDDHDRELGRTIYNNNIGRSQITGTEAGAKSAQPAWIEFMKVALADEPVEPFQPPEDIISVRIDKSTGKLTSKTDKSSLFEYFVNGTAPTDVVTVDESSIILDGVESARPSDADIF